MKRPRLKAPPLTPLLLVIVLAFQIHGAFATPKQVNSTTEVYNTGQRGASAYELWLADGNNGSLEEYIQSLKGKDGVDPKDGENGKDAVAYAVPANNGKDGIGCHADPDTLTITCGDGSSLTIPIPKDGVDGQSLDFNINRDTCYLELKRSVDRIWTPTIKDPGCFSDGSS